MSAQVMTTVSHDRCHKISRLIYQTFVHQGLNQAENFSDTCRISHFLCI
ncbi:hypothetical protein FDUTEX481_05477 [Tolypothrix sp. PCC 7601]|nr:hypothetical protein FDUTEX481_05477 [Tolypothrix sp. PCC 7601]